MLKRALIGALGATLLWAGAAQASQFDGWSVKRITSHPDFVRSDYSLSSAHNHADKGARQVYDWIGYIADGDTRVYFTSFGEPLTTVQWGATGEWVPEWVVANLDRLLEAGYIKLDVDAETPEPESETLEVGGNG